MVGIVAANAIDAAHGEEIGAAFDGKQNGLWDRDDGLEIGGHGMLLLLSVRRS
jgi:hypothetical protein